MQTTQRRVEMSRHFVPLGEECNVTRSVPGKSAPDGCQPKFPDISEC